MQGQRSCSQEGFGTKPSTLRICDCTLFQEYMSGITSLRWAHLWTGGSQRCIQRSHTAHLGIYAGRAAHARRQAEAEVGEQARHRGVVHDVGQRLPNAPAHSKHDISPLTIHVHI